MRLAISLERGKITMSEQETVVIDYTGYRKELQGRGAQFMIDCGVAWLEASEKGLSEKQAQSITVLRKQLANANTEAQKTLAKVAIEANGLEKAQKLLTTLAVKKAELQGQIDDLLLQPSLQAFQSEVLEKYGLAGTGKTGNGSSAIAGMLKCVYHKTVRYYAVSEDTVGVYAANGKSSELVVAFTKADYPKLFPGSESALQRLHHVLYGEFAIQPAPGTPVDRLDVAEEAYAKAGNWQTADTGLKTQNYNGNADVNFLDMTAGEWLAANPAKKRGK